MSDTVDSSSLLVGVAGEVLASFGNIEKQAQQGMHGESYLTPESIGVANPVRQTEALRTLDRMNLEKITAFKALIREPAIARLVVSDESGKTNTWYVCRVSPPIDLHLPLVSYRSPMGAMASRNVGASFVSPGGRAFELHQRILLHPFKREEWDSRDSLVESESAGTVTVRSLRELLLSSASFSEDVLATLLAEENTANNVVAGRRRSVIAKMGLRDQPVLDQYQDEIFRLPLDSRLLILGPPGTGKTTTLIRRLGQKLDPVALDDGESALVHRMDETSELPHTKNWLMFTPTDLLRQYVREAFAREDIPAPEERIRTWATHRHDLARNHFGILRNAAGSGIFVLKESAATITVAAKDRPTEWYEAFDLWQKATWLDSIKQAASELAADPDPEVAVSAAPSVKALADIRPKDASNAVVSMIRTGRVLQDRVGAMRTFTDNKLKSALTLQVNRDRNFIDDLAKFIDSLRDTGSHADDEEDEVSEDDDGSIEAKTPRAAAMQAYQTSLRALARARASGSSLKKGLSSERIVEWLGDRGLSPDDLEAVGRSLVQQSRLRKLLNPARSFIIGLPQRYRSFRRRFQSEKTWYHPSDTYLSTDLNPLELDVVLLAMLRNASDLLVRPGVLRGIEAADWAPLRLVRFTIRHQVLVDEATDFSPIQLACMAALANPQGKSFFACGDFNQRLTTWGSRDLSDVRWACPGILDQTIMISYRQSTQLNELAKAIVALSGVSSGLVALPEGVDNDGVPPVLAEHLSSPTLIADWLTLRIQEIENFVKVMPSVAVLVMDEAEVEPLAHALNERLVESNINAVPCRDGQSMGSQNDVRVFDIQHIKGLEFEAVFFVGVDRLAAAQPELFDKYLYVGTTRAATYLGMVCDTSLPAVLDPLRKMFSASW